MNMITYVNIIMLGVLVFFMFMGYRQGFLLKLISIFSFFVIGFLSWYLSQPFASILSLYPKDKVFVSGVAAFDQILYDNLNRIFIFIVLFVLLYVLILLLRPALRILQNIPVVSIVNKVAGCILGGFQAWLIFFIITMLLQLPFFQNGEQIVEQSYLQYCESLSKVVLFYAEEPIKELQKLDTSLSNSQMFNIEEANRFYDWLLENNISKENADKIYHLLNIE